MDDHGGAVLARVWRADMVESLHRGHAVVVDGNGDVIAAWGDIDALIYPRSSCKMLQALPLVETGAADAAGLSDAQLALACASHNGAAIHTDRVATWLNELGLDEAALRCGCQMPNDHPAQNALIRAGQAPSQLHNNCSGKHAGFLTLAQHLGAGPEYVEIDHPVQIAVRAAFEEMTGMASPHFGIDGCSAPNHATTLRALALAMARMATLNSGARGNAAQRLIAAMRAHPDLVAGEGRACTALMRAMSDGVVKTGAEGVFVAILPARGWGIALKIADGATRAAETAIAALLVAAGVMDADDPTCRAYRKGEIRNRRDLLTGHIVADDSLLAPL